MPATRTINAASTEHSTSTAIVQRTKRNAQGEDISRAVVSKRPLKNASTSTKSKAIVLRNGRNGVWGEGALSRFAKVSGQEKLALKAEEISRNALSPPFCLEELGRTAASQVSALLAVISDLHDPEFFWDEITKLIAARPRFRPTLLNGPFVSRTIASKIHNTYLLTASWKVIRDALLRLESDGLQDADVRSQLKSNFALRDTYLLVYDTVNMLSSLALQQLSLSVMGSQEFGKYFSGTKSKKFEANEKEVLLSAHRSLIDAVIIELVLPKSQYPTHILMSVLHDALETTPKEELTKFSQALYDDLSDLSVLVNMKGALDGPLQGGEGQKWLNNPRAEVARDIDEFFDAIQKSTTASSAHSKLEKFVFPLHKTKNAASLKSMWEAVDAEYIHVSGYGIDELWQVTADRIPAPQWSTWEIPSLYEYTSDVDSDGEKKPPIPNAFGHTNRPNPRAHKKGVAKHTPGKKSRPGRRKAITAGGLGDSDDEDYDDMPGLMSVSESSDEAAPAPIRKVYEQSSEEEVGEYSEQEYRDSDEESDWEGNEAAFMNDLVSEAIKEINMDPALLERMEKVEGGKMNPFVRMLRTFAGRMFNVEPTFKPPKFGQDAQSTPPKPVFGPPCPPKPAVTPVPPKVAHNPATPPPTAKGVTIEEVEDEDAQKGSKKKKKKKKSKKKVADDTKPGPSNVSLEPLPSDTIKPSPSQSPTITSPPKRKLVPDLKPPNSSSQRPGIGDDGASIPNFAGSSTSLAAGPQQAQSARSYISSSKPDGSKVKVKTRAEPNIVENDEEVGSKRTGFFAKWSGKHKDKSETTVSKGVAENSSTGKTEFLAPGGFKQRLYLPRRASKLLSRIFGGEEDETKGQAGIRWDSFVKAMKLLGFTPDTKAEGSRVRFDPPNPKDKSFTCHKPHPGSIINPVSLKKIAKDLKNLYGWSEEYFVSVVDPRPFEHDEELE